MKKKPNRPERPVCTHDGGPQRGKRGRAERIFGETMAKISQVQRETMSTSKKLSKAPAAHGP